MARDRCVDAGQKCRLGSAALLTALLAVCLGRFAKAEPIHPGGEFVTVNGAKLWVESEGQGEPLLLVAGGPGSSHSYFHPFFSALKGSYRVIYFDALGRGKSDRPSSRNDYSLERDVEDIEGLRKALGLGKINLLGHSYGGMAAQAYALRYPSSVKRLILVCTLHSGEMWQANNDNCNHEVQNQFPEIWESIQKLRLEGVRSSDPRHQKLYGTLPMGLFYFRDASDAERVPFDVNPDVYYHMVGEDADFLIGGEMNGVDFRPKLKKLAMPMLVMAGRFDRVALPRYSVQYRRYAPQARFVMVEHAGHFPFAEDSATTFRELRRFLGK